MAAEKEGQQKESKKQAKKAAKKSAGSGADAGGKGKSLPQQQKHKKPGGGKRSRVQKGQVFFEEDDDEENEGELQPKRQKVDVPKTDATMETEPPRQPETPPTSVSMAAEPKRSIPEPPGMPKKEGERERDGEGVEKGGEEKRTVFVSNLKMSVTKEDLEEKFSPCGTISEVRLIKSQSRGRANAFAYVEFAATESVQKALQLEHTELNGRIVFVSQHREKGGGGKTQQKQAGFQGNNKATVFVSNLQHNTDEQTLKDLFEKCGEVKEVRLVRNRDGRPKGFAYIEFTNEATAGSAVLQLDNHLLGMKRLKVAISNPPKKKGDGPAAPSADRTSHSRPIKDDGGFVRPSFIPARIKAQEQSEVPRKRANIGLVPRVLAKQNKEKGEEGTEGVKEGESGKEGEGGGGGGTDAMDVGKAAPQKMSNDDFRKLLDKT